MTAFATQDIALLWTAKIAALAVVISSLEYFARPKLMNDGGLLSWPVSRLRWPWLAGTGVSRVLSALLSYPNVLGLLGLRAILAVVVLLAPARVAHSPWLIVPFALVTVVFLLRSNYGLDGADQMTWLIFAGLVVVSLVNTAEVRAAYLWFIAIQCCLAYFVSGVAKVNEPKWRDGTYLAEIFRTRIYGHPQFARFLGSHPRLSATQARGIIAWECVFPLVLVAPVPLSLLILCSGVLFHLSIAHLMGLNTFLWAFTATYPAILYCLNTRGW